MKSAISAIIIAVIIVFVSIIGTSKIEKISQTMLELNQNIYNSLKSDDFINAKNNSEKLKEFIDSKETFLSAYSDRSLIDSIENNISQVDGFIEMKNKDNSFAYINQLDTQIRHLCKSSMLTLENVL